MIPHECRELANRIRVHILEACLRDRRRHQLEPLSRRGRPGLARCERLWNRNPCLRRLRRRSLRPNMPRVAQGRLLRRRKGAADVAMNVILADIRTVLAFLLGHAPEACLIPRGRHQLEPLSRCDSPDFFRLDARAMAGALGQSLALARLLGHSCCAKVGTVCTQGWHAKVGTIRTLHLRGLLPHHNLLHLLHLRLLSLLTFLGLRLGDHLDEPRRHALLVVAIVVVQIARAVLVHRRHHAIKPVVAAHLSLVLASDSIAQLGVLGGRQSALHACLPDELAWTGRGLGRIHSNWPLFSAGVGHRHA